MYINLKRFLAAFIILLAAIPVGTAIFADTRDQPIDLIVALDKSLSMEEEIDTVKEYINKYIIDERLIIDDYFLLFVFYKQTEVATAGFIHSETDKDNMKKIVSGIKADGNWTDFGRMFDRLREELTERLNNNRKKRFLVITDFINEVPTDSPYYTIDQKMKHEYLQYLDDLVVNPGWEVKILAIGSDPGSDVFSKDMKSSYSEIEEGSTAEQMNKAVGELVGDIEIVQEKMVPLKLKASGKGTLVIPVKTQLFKEPPVLNISKITINTTDFMRDALSSPYSKTLPADSVKQAAEESKNEDQGIIYLSIPVDAGKGLTEGNYQADLSFTFESDARFKSPFVIQLHVNNMWEDNPLILILLIIAGIILLILLIIGIIKLLQGHPVKFKLIIEEMPIPKGKDVFKLSKGKMLYLLESMDFIRVSDKKSTRSFAKLRVQSDDLKLDVLKDKNFAEPKEIPENILEATIEIITESGRHYHMKCTEEIR